MAEDFKITLQELPGAIEAILFVSGDPVNAEKIAELFYDGHLRCKIVRHPVAVCLVFGTHLMTESRLSPVKKDTQMIGLILLHYSENGVEETVYRTCGCTVGRGHRRSSYDSIVSTVDYRVTVN